MYGAQQWIVGAATAVWWRRCWRQPGGGGVAAALAWRRQCGGGSTYDVLHWAEEVRVRVLPIPAQGSDPCITCVPLNMSCVQKKIEEVWFISFLRTNGQFQKRTFFKIDFFTNRTFKLKITFIIFDLYLSKHVSCAKKIKGFDILVLRIKGQFKKWTFFTIDWFLQFVLLGGEISHYLLEILSSLIKYDSIWENGLTLELNNWTVKLKRSWYIT